MKSIRLNIFLLLLCLSTTTILAQEVQHTVVENSAIKQQKEAPRNYIATVHMYDDLTTYYIMPSKEIMGHDDQGDLMLIGYQQNPPKGRTEFKYMITILDPSITYAVDYYGHVWQKRYPFQEIVGTIKTK